MIELAWLTMKVMATIIGLLGLTVGFGLASGFALWNVLRGPMGDGDADELAGPFGIGVTILSTISLVIALTILGGDA
jgi:hypothetical protein